MRDTFDQALTWTRPDFLALRYELLCPTGVVARVSVDGMGDSKHALGETSEGAWRFEVFPFASDIVSIHRAFGAAGVVEDEPEAGSYLRTPPFEIRLNGAGTYRVSAAGIADSQSRLEDEAGRPVFSFEQIESFPKWQAEVKLDPSAIEIAELPVLVLAACCLRVFR